MKCYQVQNGDGSAVVIMFTENEETGLALLKSRYLEDEDLDDDDPDKYGIFNEIWPVVIFTELPQKGIIACHFENEVYIQNLLGE